MKLAYIIAPYSGINHIQVKQNISEAEILSQYYWYLNYAVICPHLNTAFFSGLIPEKKFYFGTLLMLSKCDIAIVHPDYKNSSGSLKEISFAEKNNIKLEFISKLNFLSIKKYVRDLIFDSSEGEYLL